MNEGYVQALQDAIRNTRECESRHIRSVPILEEYNGEKVWDGNVELFALSGCKEAESCYAWGYKREDGSVEYVTVLQVPPIRTALDAIRAFIIHDAKKKWPMG
jgi:hypothetical protein